MWRQGTGCSGLKNNKRKWKYSLDSIFPICFTLHTYSKPLLFLSVFIRAGNAYTWAAFFVVHDISLWVYCLKSTPKTESEESVSRGQTQLTNPKYKTSWGHVQIPSCNLNQQKTKQKNWLAKELLNTRICHSSFTGPMLCWFYQEFTFDQKAQLRLEISLQLCRYQ